MTLHLSSEEYVEIGGSDCAENGRTESRKVKVKSKAAKQKVKTKTKRSISSKHRSTSEEGISIFMKVIALAILSVKLIVDMILALPKGAEKRKEATAHCLKYLKDGALLFKREPATALKMIAVSIFLLFLFLTTLSAIGPDLRPSIFKDPRNTIQLTFSISHANLATPSAVIADGEEIVIEEGIPMPADPIKKKMTKKLEIGFACAEVDCLESCTRKTTKKCLASDGCMKQRLNNCKKKCRKQRCELRCKTEPQIGYVEREMKLDKCKEDCQSNGKCIEKCEKTYQTCKSKCGERRKKFVCDRAPNIPLPSQIAAAALSQAVEEEEEVGESSDDAQLNGGVPSNGVEDEEI